MNFTFEKITLAELLRRSANDIGMISDSEQLDALTADRCAVLANEVVAEWNNDEALFPYFMTEIVKLNGSHFYNLSDVASSGIKGVFFKDSLIPSTELQLLTTSDYQRLKIDGKDFKNGNPNYYFFENNLIDKKIFVYPNSNSGEIHVVSSGQFKRFSDLNVNLELPDAYILAIKYAVAVKMAIKYKLEITDDYKSKAVALKAKVSRSAQEGITDIVQCYYPGMRRGTGTIRGGWQ